MKTKPKLRFFVDNCVPESVPVMLEALGHYAIRLRDRILPDSPDALVATLAETFEEILLTADRDFKMMVQRHSIGKREFNKLSLLRFEKCRESQMAARLELAMSLVLHEWELGQASSDRRMFVVITANTIRTHR